MTAPVGSGGDTRRWARLPWRPLAAAATAAARGGPWLFRGVFEMEAGAAGGPPGDAWLDVRAAGFTRGFACVNGFNLRVGRHLRCGPQLALFVPAPLLRAGRNELVVFELEAPIVRLQGAPTCEAPAVHLEPTPLWHEPKCGALDSHLMLARSLCLQLGDELPRYRRIVRYAAAALMAAAIAVVVAVARVR